MIFAALWQSELSVKAVSPNDFHIVPILNLPLDEGIFDLEE
jgi:hypothetical protein